MKLIVAMDESRGIGKNGKLPWKNSADMKHFAKTTENGILIMGSKTLASLPGLLKGRHHIVLSSNPAVVQHPAIQFAKNTEHAASLAFGAQFVSKSNRETFVIGGGTIYKEFLISGLVDEMIITHIKGTHECDTFFPDFDMNDWRITKMEPLSDGSIVKTYQKIKIYL